VGLIRGVDLIDICIVGVGVGMGMGVGICKGMGIGLIRRCSTQYVVCVPVL
jgi:hypothetical protein